MNVRLIQSYSEKSTVPVDTETDAHLRWIISEIYHTLKETDTRKSKELIKKFEASIENISEELRQYENNSEVLMGKYRFFLVKDFEKFVFYKSEEQTDSIILPNLWINKEGLKDKGLAAIIGVTPCKEGINVDTKYLRTSENEKAITSDVFLAAMNEYQKLASEYGFKVMSKSWP